MSVLRWSALLPLGLLVLLGGHGTLALAQRPVPQPPAPPPAATRPAPRPSTAPAAPTAPTAGVGQAVTIRADVQEADSRTGVVTARGNVRIFYPARQMQGSAAQAQYFSKERRIVLTGNVLITQGANTLRGETVTYLIDQGRFEALPQTSQQVESTYFVPDASATPSATPSPTPTR